jgi:phosphoenolpyruvate carboxykinase (ATP)
MTDPFNLEGHWITVAEIHRNLPPSARGAIVMTKTQRDPVFGFDVVAECPQAPTEILTPRNVWADKVAYETTAKKLAGLFIENFRKYESGTDAEVKPASPVV